MARYLIVANLTVVGDELYELVKDRVERGPAEIHVLVPAGAGAGGAWTHVEGEDIAAARKRLEAAVERFADLGAEVTGEVGDASPVQAVGDVLRTGATFDEVIVSTLPQRSSKWLRMDLPRRLERAYGLNVTHVVGASG
jgi:hypothetical protein